MRQMTDMAPDDRFVAAMLLVFCVAATTDVVLDAPASIWSFHILVELTLIATSLAAAVYLFRRVRASRRELERTRLALGRENSEANAWRRRAERFIRGLGEEMDGQFDAWQLTPTEKEVALFLVKGFSTKEIAHLTGRSERTVRQHAIAVYGKSNLRGRAELSAFFLEDLLTPATRSSQKRLPTVRLFRS